MQNLTIHDWAAEDRPREKLESMGAEALTNAELLAILIGSGTAKQSAVDLMKTILNDCNNNLNTLGKMTIRQLETFKGIGPAKAITILAACELGKRRAREKAEERSKLDSAQAIYELMHPKMQDLDVEEFHILLMNQSFKLIKEVRISHGGITETAVDIRVIMRRTTSSPTAYIRHATSCVSTSSTMSSSLMVPTIATGKKEEYNRQTATARAKPGR